MTLGMARGISGLDGVMISNLEQGPTFSLALALRNYGWRISKNMKLAYIDAGLTLSQLQHETL